MLKSRELRLGNWVMQGGVETIVDSLSRNIKDWDRTNNKRTIDCEPIPITEQWLIDFGFEKSGKWFTKGMFISELNISVVYKTATILDTDEARIHFPEFIHQLQNLYFALTGEELTKQR